MIGVDERGDRTLELVRGADSIARDTNPAISPDGRWIVFASSRGQPLDHTSLWIAPVAPEAVATALVARSTAIDPPPHSLAGSAVTLGNPRRPREVPDGGRGTHPGGAVVIDSYPTWTRDGTAIVFASTRGGTGFDLYQLAVDRRGRSVGQPVALTASPGHEVTPSVALDGTIIYGAITPTPEGQVESHIEARQRDGAIRRITQGPADTSPAVSPDGNAIAFARPVTRASGVDADLWLAAASGEAARQLVDVPLTDESGPTWSLDGRFIFATSVLRGASGAAVFSAVIVVDTAEAKPIARILMDRTGAVARLTPAVAVADLNATALRQNPEYLPEIARIAAAAIAAQKRRGFSE